MAGAQVGTASPGSPQGGEENGPQIGGLEFALFRLVQWLKSPRPYLMVLGFGLFLGFWYLSGRGLEAAALQRHAGPDGRRRSGSAIPAYGLSIYTPEYYQHIWVSIRRVAIAFFLATVLGVPLGLLLGLVADVPRIRFPVFEMLRPIPILAWVPLAILMFTGAETPVIFLTFLAVVLRHRLEHDARRRVDRRVLHPRGALPWRATTGRCSAQVIMPGAMPFIFTGLQISIGVAWFSLVAGEMVSGEYRPGLRDQHLLHDGALPDDHHRHGDVRHRSATPPVRWCAWPATT